MCPGAEGGEDVRGAEVEVTMLFADVRGSSKLARQMPVLDFTHLMNRIYGVSRPVLIEHDAIIEKFVGTRSLGLFIPFMAGADHVNRVVEAAEALLRATGHGSAESPWYPSEPASTPGPRSSGSWERASRATSPHSAIPSTSPRTWRQRPRSARSC